MKKNNSGSFWLGALLAVIIMFALVRFGMSLGNSSGGTAKNSGGGAAAVQADGVQRGTIGFSNKTFNYDPSVIRLKRGVPAEITLALDVPGCMGVLISRPLNIQLEAEAGKNIARFTPEKTGTFSFSCPMGMGTGKIIVE